MHPGSRTTCVTRRLSPGGRLPDQRGQERRRQIQRVERQLVQQRARATTAPVRRISLVPSAEPCQRAYISEAVAGAAAPRLSPKRSSSGTASGSGSSPSRATSRWATWTRPASSAPQVTSAAELPATSAMPADRGPAGRRQRDQQQRRRPEERVPVGPAAARTPDQHADRPPPPTRSPPQRDAPASVAHRAVPAEERGRRHDERRRGDQKRELPGQPQPDRHALGRWCDAPAEAADEVGRREQQSRRRAPRRTSGAETAGARARRRRSSAECRRAPSTPAEPESGPSSGRKKVAGEKSGWSPSAGPTRRADRQPEQPGEERDALERARLRG